MIVHRDGRVRVMCDCCWRLAPRKPDPRTDLDGWRVDEDAVPGAMAASMSSQRGGQLREVMQAAQPAHYCPLHG